MKRKIVSLLLVCLVALSIVYVCSSIALPSSATQSIDAVLSRTTTANEESCQDLKLPYRGPKWGTRGEAVEDPIPH